MGKPWSAPHTHQTYFLRYYVLTCYKYILAMLSYVWNVRKTHKTHTQTHMS